MKFTKSAIGALEVPMGKSEAFFWDDDLPGFGVRIRAGGKRTFVVQFRVGRQQRRLSLGRVEALDLSEARRQARAAIGKAGVGEDAQASKLAARQRQRLLFATVADRFLERQASRLRPNSYRETRRYLKESLRGLNDRGVDGITRAEVAEKLASIARNSGPVAADRARAATSAMYSWAMREGLAESNPVALTNKHSEPKQGDRFLSDEELALVWRACRDDDFGHIVRLLMLTGCRREEVAAMTWAELDPDQRLWIIPGSRIKNRRSHEIPLSNQAIDIIDRIERREGRDLLFGRRTGGFSGWSRAKAALDARVAELCQADEKVPPEPWRLHDLRRTVATRVADLGLAQPHVVEAILNHVSGHKAGIAGVYNKASYREEKRRALEGWGRHVTDLVTDGFGDDQRAE